MLHTIEIARRAIFNEFDPELLGILENRGLGANGVFGEPSEAEWSISIKADEENSLPIDTGNRLRGIYSVRGRNFVEKHSWIGTPSPYIAALETRDKSSNKFFTPERKERFVWPDAEKPQ